MPARAVLAAMAAVMTVALSLLATTGVTPARAFSGMATGSPRQAPLQAFVLSSAPDSLVDLEAHAQAVGVMYPTYFDCALRSGRIVGRDIDTITAYANARGIAVMPRFNCQDGPTVHRILTDPRVRARTLAGLARIAQAQGYAGLNLDLENDVAADRPALSSFVTVLARLLHARGRRLAVDVVGVDHEDPTNGTGFYDDRAIVAASDYVFVMAWGAHWAGSRPGPIAPLSYVSAVARHLASLPHAARFVLGAPMYALDWPLPPGPSRRAEAVALQYARVLALARSVGATPMRDRSVDEMTFSYSLVGITHRVWYMDARSISDRLRIARSYGLAAGVWRLGGEDQGIWSSPFV